MSEMNNLLKEKKLTNGLNHIKDIIYLKQSLKMYKKYKELSELNIKVVGIKTDALLYIDNDGASDKLLKNYNMENKIEKREDSENIPIRCVDFTKEKINLDKILVKHFL
jgi:hypothetical protein